MVFLIKLVSECSATIPLNYPYPLSAVIYKILSKGNSKYAEFLHEKGYGKGFKFFTFSQLKVPFKIEGERRDRMRLMGNEATFQVGFHLPEAMENFVKGLFQSEEIVIADKQSKAVFTVKSIESLPNPLAGFGENEIVSVQLKPLSPIAVGLKNERGNYDYKEPGDAEFIPSLIYNWRSKIKDCYDEETSEKALLLAEVIPMKNPPKSRLITIKAGTGEETQVRGWMNFGLKVTAERRFVELLLNAGCGVYNAMGFGCVEVVGDDKNGG